MGPGADHRGAGETITPRIPLECDVLDPVGYKESHKKLLRIASIGTSNKVLFWFAQKQRLSSFPRATI